MVSSKWEVIVLAAACVGGAVGLYGYLARRRRLDLGTVKRKSQRRHFTSWMNMRPGRELEEAVLNKIAEDFQLDELETHPSCLDGLIVITLSGDPDDVDDAILEIERILLDRPVTQVTLSFPQVAQSVCVTMEQDPVLRGSYDVRVETKTDEGNNDSMWAIRGPVKNFNLAKDFLQRGIDQLMRDYVPRRSLA